MGNICLFGGSFDPVHNGHLLVALAAREELPAERVIRIPAWQSPFKPERKPASAANRNAMLRLALAGKPWCEIDDLEIQRGGVSYTVDTLRSFARKYPGDKLLYLVGADNVPQLDQWREAGELARLAEFIAVPRFDGLTSVAAEHPPAPPGFSVRYLRGFPNAISSTTIRARVAQGLAVNDLVPLGVEQYILNNRLYL